MKINSQRLNQNHYNWFLCYTGSRNGLVRIFNDATVHKQDKLNAKVRTLRDRVTKCKSENTKGMAPLH